MDEAERDFLDAYRISKTNLSINRELASLYCKQRQYVEAEPFARAAYKSAPTNPYIIDILTETLLGKQVQAQDHSVDGQEIADLLAALRTYGDAPGRSFFSIRDAQVRLHARDTRGALEALDRAIAQTPELANPYFMRAELHLRGGDTIRARSDLDKISEILEAAGGLSEGDEARATELDVEIEIADGSLRAAKDKLDAAQHLPHRISGRLKSRLARAVGFRPTQADRELISWAKTVS